MLIAAKNTCEKLIKYYNKITPLYCIVSAMDLQINLEYFRNEGWDEQLIKDWKSKMEEIWEEYKPENSVIAPIKEIVNDEDFLTSIYKKKQRLMVSDELEK